MSVVTFAPIARSTPTQRHQADRPIGFPERRSAQPSAPALSREVFAESIEREYCDGSAIDFDLFAFNVRFGSDTEITATGDPIDQLADWLNWRRKQGGFSRRETVYGAALINEDSTCWQVKLSRPIKVDGKDRTKLAPAGNGARLYLPVVTLKIWRKIAIKHNLPEDLPWQRVLGKFKSAQPESIAGSPNSATDFSQFGQDLATATTPSNSPGIQNKRFRGFATESPKNSQITDSRDWMQLSQLDSGALKRFVSDLPGRTPVPDFWNLIKTLVTLPINWTEGGKKSLSLLSQGYISIALYGVNSGYQKNVDGTRSLTPWVREFCQPGRQHYIVFDQDAPSKRKRTDNATYQFAKLLETEGQAKEVLIAKWNGKHDRPENQRCKGVDDLIAHDGAEAWDRAYNEARSFLHWELKARLDNRLTLPANITMKTKDLSAIDLGEMPKEGIIAIASPKGTGKTKLMGKLVADSEKVVLQGHRIALMRNLAARLGVNYLGDLDKAHGKFIAGGMYTVRVGSCIDSVLAIDPEQFRGCDLVIDEVVQVLEHEHQSGTCNKDGKRPAILAQLRNLCQVARRLIVADADLDDQSLAYLQSLRGDGSKPFLIQNDIEVEGFPVRFIVANDRSAVLADIIGDARKLGEDWRRGDKYCLHVACSTKADAKAIARIVEQESGGVPALEITSETSGGEVGSAFMLNPDLIVNDMRHGFYVTSPSLATGNSIEINGAFRRVYGVFSGDSISDRDMAQALSRVREPVERVVWCAKTGRNFNKISRSTKPQEIADALKTRTSAIVRLVRSSLNEDTARAFSNHDWDASPHITLYAHQAANHNRSMYHLRDALLVRLQEEGNAVTIVQAETNKEVRDALQDVRQQITLIDAEQIAAARDLTLAEKLELEIRSNVSPEDRQAVTKFNLREFYGLEEVTIDDVLADRNGRRRGELLNLEAQLYKEITVDRTVRSLERQASWGQWLCPWDVSNAELRRMTREILGLDDFLDSDKTWHKYDLRPYADRIRQCANDIKAVLNLTISPKMADTQLVHSLLSQLGIKLTHKFSRSVLGYEGEKLKVYRLDAEKWGEAIAILDRRKAERDLKIEKYGDGGMVVDVSSEGRSLTNAQIGEVLCCQEMAEMAVASGDPATIEAILNVLKEALADTPQLKAELWTRLSVECREAFQQAREREVAR